MNKHTLGPWKVSTGNTGRFRTPTIEVTALHDSGIDQTVAHITGISSGKANARLIAAAPDLLEALEEVLAYCVEHGHDWMCMAQARAAIAKATGEA